MKPICWAPVCLLQRIILSSGFNEEKENNNNNKNPLDRKLMEKYTVIPEDLKSHLLLIYQNLQILFSPFKSWGWEVINNIKRPSEFALCFQLFNLSELDSLNFQRHATIRILTEQLGEECPGDWVPLKPRRLRLCMVWEPSFKGNELLLKMREIIWPLTIDGLKLLSSNIIKCN